MSTRPWTLPGAEGETILGDTHRPEHGPPRGVLLLCHGFKGYKDYGLLPALAARAADAGFLTHRFNFSHSGMTGRVETFERPELFERDTWGKQVFDLLAVARAARDGLLPAGSAEDRAGAGLPQVWFGHSRGGVTCLLAAAEWQRAAGPTDDAGPAGIVTAGSPHRACSLSEADRATLRAQGRLRSPSSRTGQDLYVGRAWLDEVEREPHRYDPYRAAGVIRCPRLILHGTADTTVPVRSAHAYHDAVGGRGSLRLIEGASHTFDAPNPLEPAGPLPAATEALITATLAFARRVAG